MNWLKDKVLCFWHVYDNVDYDARDATQWKNKAFSKPSSDFKFFSRLFCVWFALHSLASKSAAAESTTVVQKTFFPFFIQIMKKLLLFCCLAASFMAKHFWMSQTYNNKHESFFALNVEWILSSFKQNLQLQHRAISSKTVGGLRALNRTAWSSPFSPLLCRHSPIPSWCQLRISVWC